MVTAVGIILTDVLLFVLFVFEYRQELGLSVNGSHDLPVARKKSVKNSPATAAGDPAGRRRQVVVRS
jgi:hypothetical protein